MIESGPRKRRGTTSDDAQRSPRAGRKSLIMIPSILDAGDVQFEARESIENDEHGLGTISNGLLETQWIHSFLYIWPFGGSMRHNDENRQIVGRAGCRTIALLAILAIEHPFPAVVTMEHSW